MRAVIVLVGLTFGPGGFLLTRFGFRLSPGWTALTVAAATSLALETLVATALAVAGVLTPAAFLAGVVATTAAAALGPGRWIRRAEPS